MNLITPMRACCALAIAALLAVVADGQTPQGFFTDVTPVLTNANFSDFDIAVTGDDLTLVFTNAGGRGGEGGEDMWLATRSDPNLPFENIVNLGPTVNSPENDGVGSISPDGRTLYFGSNRAGDFDLYQATRSSLAEPFDNVTALGPGVNTLDVVENSPSVTADGLVMAYHSRPDVEPEVERDIWIATRDSTSQEFGNAAPLGAAVNEYSETWPNLSGDGLALLWSDWIEFPPRPGGQGSLDIWVSYRQSRDEEFVAVANLNNSWPGTDVNGPFADAAPYLSPNWPAVGSKLYFVSNRLTGALVADVFQATWVPEPSTMLLAFFGLVALGKFRN